MASNEIRFFAGEIKEVTAVVHSKTVDEVVVINSATFELTDGINGTTISEGTCEVQGSEASVLLEMPNKGIYEIVITANVGREVIKEKAIIKVI